MFDAIAKVVGGLLDSQSARSRQQSAENIATQNMQAQRDFAQMGVRWRVDDAKAAGIHPLAALGMQGPSFSPVTLGDTGSTSWSTALSGMGLDKMGQDTSRAIAATQSDAKRASSLELAGKQLDNDLKATQLASSVAKLKSQTGPGLPIPEEKKFDERPLLSPAGTKKSDVDRGDYWFWPWSKTDSSSVNQETGEKRYGDSADWIEGMRNRFLDYFATSGGVGHQMFDYENRTASRARDTYRQRYENARQHRSRSDYYLFR